MTSCVFCDIIAGDAPADIVCEWPETVAFTPLNPVVEGHTLIVPRTHVLDAVQSPFITAMSRAAEFASRYDASNILTSVGKAATQSVFHLHIHVIPRTFDDQLMLPWGTTGDPHAPHSCPGMEALAAELRRGRTVYENFLAW